jgi:hypothetical protein
VFVRDLSAEEATRLRRISRQSKVFALRLRAQTLLASDSKVGALEIARVLQTDENQVRRVIREFNADGMDSLRPPTGGGHPRRIDDATTERVREIALARPGDLGTRWSLSRLRRYLIRSDRDSVGSTAPDDRPSVSTPVTLGTYQTAGASAENSQSLSLWPGPTQVPYVPPPPRPNRDADDRQLGSMQPGPQSGGFAYRSQPVTRLRLPRVLRSSQELG